MPARIKVMRLFGAVLVTLALVPWLGVSPAAATAGGTEDSSYAKGHKDSGNKASKSDDKADKLDQKSARQAGQKAAKRSEEKARQRSGQKSGAKADQHSGKADQGASAGEKRSANQKVTLCHRTNSESNPYVRITVSINSVVKGSGHGGHNGPIFQAGMKSAKQKWGDIIPSFTYTTKSGSIATYGGKNWPSGRAIFDAGCTVSRPTTTTSGSLSTTTTVSQSTASPDTSVAPTKIGATDDTEVLGTKNGPLAETGLDLPLRAALGLSFLLMIAGAALMVVPARAAEERKRRH